MSVCCCRSCFWKRGFSDDSGARHRQGDPRAHGGQPCDRAAVRVGRVAAAGPLVHPGHVHRHGADEARRLHDSRGGARLPHHLVRRQVAKRHREGTGPRGFGAAVEAMVLFVRDDVALGSIGHGGEKFVPLIETLFFFILYCNLLGLLPWGATPTGNLAVTGGLALIAFVVIEISGFRALGPKGYLKTIVVVPAGMTGVGAVIMAFIMTPVELIGKLVKPFALCLRLFANMTAGHFVILSLLGLIFLFANWFIAGGTVLFVLFMMCLELLVAFLQAYIFALLTSVFIGLMQHEH